MEQAVLILMGIGGAMIGQFFMNLWRRFGSRIAATNGEETDMETETPLQPGGQDNQQDELPENIKNMPETPRIEQFSVNAKPERLPEIGLAESVRVRSSPIAYPAKIGGRPAVNLPPYRATYKSSPQESEDRIYTGVLAERYPVIIVADGASTSITGGREVSGYGGEAAELAFQISREHLEQAVQPVKRSIWSKEEPITLDGILKELRDIYRVVAQDIRKQEIAGSTTLLIAILAEVSGGVYWVYAHLGDGWMTLLNPSRQINNWLIPSFLVSPGHRLPGGGTATLPDLSFPPVVGVIVHHPGDVLVVASDGIGMVEKTLFAQTHRDIGNIIWEDNFARQPSRVPLRWRIPGIEDIRLSDDLSIGVIWTGGDHGRNRRMG